MKQANFVYRECRNSMRVLTAMLTLGNGVYEFDGIERKEAKAKAGFMDGLQQLGADVVSKFDNGCPPV